MKQSLLAVLIIFISIFSHAEPRKKHSVIGVSEGVNAMFYEAIECQLAIRDAQYQASQLCYEEGFNRGWTYASYSSCSNRWLGMVSGKTVEMTFYCE